MFFRLSSRLLMFVVVLLGVLASVAAQTTTAPQAPPMLEERLERLAAEIERNRIDLHVPGAALAIVRGDQVIFARGFGLANVANRTAVTPSTPFFIGSTTKAFTATLIGMLVDEGRMQWDDPVEKYVPEFKLAVQSKNPGDRATLRDVLSHRTGFMRMVFLDMNTGMSSEEMLRRASSAEPFAPVRQRFLYNNQHYVAAGLAAAAAAGASWHTLVKDRILTPLGMTATRTTLDAWSDPRTARGYSWDEARKEHTPPVTLERLGINIDGLAPAGAISSTALDMTAWLRFLLRQGVSDGKPLISPASLTATLTPQIKIGAGGYGMGWIVGSWKGQPMMQHDGSVPGFSAIVGLLPKSDLGFVFLTNSQFLLPATAVQLVPQYLLGELPPAPSRTIDLRPYVGRYVANFATFSNETFTVSERNRRLWIDIPSRLESALNPPRADGRWSLVRSEQPEVSFDRDKSGRVVGLKLHEGGAEFEVPREGVVIAPEIPLDELRKYVSRYRDVAGSLELELFIQNQRLAVRLPNDATMDLRPPDATGRRVARANNGIALVFEESPAGAVTGVNFHRPGAVPVMRMTPVLDTLPSVAEIIALRRIPTATASSAPFSTMRTTGRIRFAQSGVDGRFTLMTAGDSRSRTELDLGRFGQNQIVMNNGRLWRAVTGDSVSEIGGKQLKQIRLSHPSVLFGDWRKYYDSVRVVRAGQLEGRKLYGIQLESAGLPPTRVAVDAETGDVLQEQRTMVLAGVGAIASTTTYSDYRDVGGMRVSHRYVETNEQIGRTIYEVERVEVGVELGPDTFRAPTAKSDGERRR